MRCFYILLTIITLLVACGEENNDSKAAPTTQSTATTSTVADQQSDSKQTSTTTAAMPGRPEYDPVSPEIHDLPKPMAFDPCGLISDGFAQSQGIPTDQRIERVGGTRKIPEDHRYTPYVGCIWRSVAQAVPRVAIEVQQGAENLKVNDAANVALGDAAWFGERKGRTELRVHQGNYVIFVRADLPNKRDEEKQVHESIAKHIIDALTNLPAGSRLPLQASAFGGPSDKFCKLVRGAGIADLLPGPKVWAFPTAAINQVPANDIPKPDADFVGCTFAGTTRGSVNVRFLGADGVKRQFSLYETKTPVRIGELDGFRNRNGVYLPYGEGAFELTEILSPFDDELLPEKLENIMQNIIEATN